MRIIAGSLRGSRLGVPAVEGLRPTPDRLRETLFNWLAPTIEGARAVDLFAGSGALGVEAASRGAASVVLIERDRAAATALREAVDRLRIGERVRVDEADAIGWLDRAEGPFDLVFVDPPFAAGLWSPVLDRLLRSGALSRGACVYVERPVSADWPWPSGWTIVRSSRAGDSEGFLLRPAPEAQA